MSEHVRDEGDLRRYFSQVPHLVVDDDRLTRDDKALYLYYVRVCGQSGVCFQANKTVAEGVPMSATLLKESRSRLADFGYVEAIERPGAPTLVTIRDVWDENFAMYAGGRLAATQPGRVATTGGRVATGGGRETPTGGRAATGGGRVATPKKNPLPRNPEEELIQEDSPKNTARDVAVQVLEGRHWIFALYENAIGFVNGTIHDDLLALEGLYPEHWIKDAFDECTKAAQRDGRAKSYRYLASILQRWASEGRSPRKAATGPAEDDMSARAQFLRRSAQRGA